MQKNRRRVCSILILNLFIIACSCGLFGKNQKTPEARDSTPEVPGIIATTSGEEEKALQPEVNPTPVVKPALEETPETSPGQVKGQLAAEPVNGGALTNITDLWTDPDGKLWVATLDGIYIQSGNGWSHTLEGTPVVKIGGVGKPDQVWVFPSGGRTALAYEGGAWKEYGSDKGWVPVPDDQYLAPAIQDTLTVATDGAAWLATGLDDLRRFDSATGRWKKYSAAQVGFPAYNNPDYQGYFLSDSVVSGGGKIWVGACIGEGESLKGRGVVRLEDGNWRGIPAVENACVFDIEVNPDGVAYVGDFDRLFRYNPVSGNWTQEKLPAYDRSQLVERIDLDANAGVWVEVRRMGGASSFGGTAVYLFEEDFGWTTVYEPPQWTSYDFAISGDGDVYFSAGGAVFQWINRQPRELGTLDSGEVSLAVDGSGTLWAGARDGADVGLWKLMR